MEQYSKSSLSSNWYKNRTEVSIDFYSNIKTNNITLARILREQLITLTCNANTDMVKKYKKGFLTKRLSTR